LSANELIYYFLDAKAMLSPTALYEKFKSAKIDDADFDKRSKSPEWPKLGPLVPVIDAILEADKTATPPKQRHTSCAYEGYPKRSSRRHCSSANVAVTVLDQKGSGDETSCWDRIAGFALQAKPAAIRRVDAAGRPLRIGKFLR
jgi:hypothetical protein